MTVVWAWLALNVGVILGAWWASAAHKKQLEAMAWECMNWHTGHCPGCKNYDETGVQCADGEALEAAWRKHGA